MNQKLLYILVHDRCHSTSLAVEASEVAREVVVAIVQVRDPLCEVSLVDLGALFIHSFTRSLTHSLSHLTISHPCMLDGCQAW